jgi:hypothetical protein
LSLEIAGLQKDDQILTVNDANFALFTIRQAIDFFSSHNNVIIKLRRAFANESVEAPRFLLSSSPIIFTEEEEEEEGNKEKYMSPFLKKSHSIRQIKLLRDNIDRSFGFTVNTAVEGHHLGKLIVTK